MLGALRGDLLSGYVEALQLLVQPAGLDAPVEGGVRKPPAALLHACHVAPAAEDLVAGAT
eukprot:8361039-Pyramimonas_sp.AAC.2